MKWNIISDSSCNLFDNYISDPDISFKTVPFVIRCDDKEMIDNENIDLPALYQAMKNSKTTATSCPSPYAFEENLNEEDNFFIVTISANLSGSYNAALSAIQNFNNKHIHIINSISAGTGQNMIIDKLVELIKQGLNFEEIVEKIEEYKKQISICFALCSYDNLVKNGRMSKIAGFVASKLNFWGIGIGSPEGTIEVIEKTRLLSKVFEIIANDIEKRGPRKERIIISHSDNEETANKLAAYLKEKFPACQITIYPNRGLCAYYAEYKGMIISCD